MKEFGEVGGEVRGEHEQFISKDDEKQRRIREEKKLKELVKFKEKSGK